jgi:hypothetical protein
MSRYISQLFARGVETWDRATNEAHNVGGARFLPTPGVKSNRCPVKILHSKLRKALEANSLSLFQVSKTEIDQEGNPIPAPNGRGALWTLRGLALYDVNEEEESTLKIIEDIRTALADDKRNRGHLIYRMSDFSEFYNQDLLDQNGELKDIQIRTLTGATKPVNPKHLIFIPFPSGPEGHDFLWTRHRVVRDNTVTEEQTEEMLDGLV